jgi:hypothetical protein
MAFIEVEEMKTVMYDYQMDAITENDDSIILMGIETAVEQVKSFFTPNGQHEYRDGRLIYDATLIFGSTGTDRNPLIISIVKTVAEYWILQLCNADIVYQQVKERYDRNMEWLKKLQKGEVSMSSLPTIDPFDETTNPNAPTLYYGSRTKFNHE